MNYKKNIITYFVMSTVLLIVAVCFEIFVVEKVSKFIVSISIGAATGIVATMVACIFDNNQKLQEGILLFERTGCHILGELYKIANLDLKQDVTNKVNHSAMAIYDYFIELQGAAKEINLLFISRKREQKLNEVYNQLENIFVFVLTEYVPLGNIKKSKLADPDKFALFEALKAIKFAREFNPQSILKIIQKSKNNRPTTISGREEFFNIIFERDIFNKEMEKEGNEIMEQRIKSLNDIYSQYDIEKAISEVDKIQIGDWSFSTKTSRKEDREVKKFYRSERND